MKKIFYVAIIFLILIISGIFYSKMYLSNSIDRYSKNHLIVMLPFSEKREELGVELKKAKTLYSKLLNNSCDKNCIREIVIKSNQVINYGIFTRDINKTKIILDKILLLTKKRNGNRSILHPIYYAIITNNIELLKYLIEKEYIPVNVKEGKSDILFFALSLCRSEIVAWLVSDYRMYNKKYWREINMTPYMLSTVSCNKVGKMVWDKGLYNFGDVYIYLLKRLKKVVGVKTSEL